MYPRVFRDFVEAGHVQVVERFQLILRPLAHVLGGERVHGEVRNPEVEDPVHHLLELLLTLVMAQVTLQVAAPGEPPITVHDNRDMLGKLALYQPVTQPVRPDSISP